MHYHAKGRLHLGPHWRGYDNTLVQWFSTFLTLQHTNFVKQLCGTPKCNKKPKWWKMTFFCILYQTLYNLAAHLEEFDGTLVRRGTPVEKHCSSQSRDSQPGYRKEEAGVPSNFDSTALLLMFYYIGCHRLSFLTWSGFAIFLCLIDCLEPKRLKKLLFFIGSQLF